MEFNKYKKPLIYIVVIVGVLILMIAIGFPLGILSENPDGLERVLIDQNGETWLENLPAFWIPLLSWIQNEYVAGFIGVGIAAGLMILIFQLITNFKKRIV